MEWRESDGVRWLEADLGRARAAFSTRLGGVSEAPFDSLNLGILTDDDADAVVENRRRLAAALGLRPGGDPDRPPGPRQPSSPSTPSRSGRARSPSPAPSSRRSTATSTAEPGLAPLVFVADCLPVALAGPGGVGDAALRLARAGAAASSPRGVEAVGATDAAIGPGIGPCCYEVGDEVLAPRSPASARGSRRAACSTCPRSRGGCWRGAGVERIESAGLCTSCEAELFFSHRRDAGRTGRQAGLVWIEGGELSDAAGLIHGLDPAQDRRQPRAGARGARGRRSRSSSPTKYVPLEEMGALAEAGVTLVGENRQQDLAAKHERWGDAFEWDFIGNLQSRKVKQLLPLCRLIHSVATDSALEQLGRHGEPGHRGPGRGQRRRGGGQGRRRARRARRLHRSAARSRVVGPDDDAAVQPGPRGLAAAFRPPRASSRPSTG